MKRLRLEYDRGDGIRREGVTPRGFVLVLGPIGSSAERVAVSSLLAATVVDDEVGGGRPGFHRSPVPSGYLRNRYPEGATP